MEFREVLTIRRSCRAFKDTPVPQETIDGLLEAFCWAPSPLHQQPWSFVVLSGDEAKAGVRAVAEAAKAAVGEAGGPGWAAKYDTSFLEAAPVLVAVVFDPAKGGLGSFFNQPHGALCAAAAGIQNLMLAAAAAGLGTVWFTFFDPGEMGRALGVPDDLEVAGIIPVGHPQGEIKTPPRREPEVFTDSYGG